MDAARRLAIVDLGSNTARLVVIGYVPGHSFRLLDELRQVVRLAEGMGGGRVLRAAALARGLAALKTFRAYCDAAAIDEVIATATSAVRDAANGAEFLAAAAELGLPLQVLSGEEEAAYGALAVANSLSVRDAFVIDVGGGSAQLSRLEARRFAGGTSWPLGAVRMSEGLSDPPKKKEIKALVKHLRAAFKGDQTPGLECFGEGLPLVGMGGTVRNLADVHKKRVGYPLDLVHGYVLERSALDALIEDLLVMSTAAKRELPGLNSDRADIIAAGAVVVRELLAASGAPSLTVSGQGLREGLFYSRFSAASSLLGDPRRFGVLNLMRQYYDHPAHNAHVETLALALFDGLAVLHGYGAFERELLAAAALVHDIGMAVNYYDHHKHGFYLAMSAALPGFSHREQALVALLVRYHRKGKPGDEGLGALLQEGDMTRVHRLAALLRLAEYLERSKAQTVSGVRCHIGDGAVQLVVVAAGEARVEIQEAMRRSDLFAAAFGVPLEIVSAP